MPVGLTTAIGLGVGAAASVGGAAIQAGAASGAAAEERKMQKKAAKMAAPSAQELALLDKQLKQTELGLERQRKLLEAVDPALMEAGKQALELLGGKEAAVLAPLRSEQERQRNLLRQRLQQQLGPGYETTSAGIEAMSRFEEKAQANLANAQQQALGSLLGQGQASVQSSGIGFQGAAALGIPLESLGNIKKRQLDAFLGAKPQTPSTAGQSIMGQSLANLGGGFAGLLSQQDMFNRLMEQQKEKKGITIGGGTEDVGLPILQSTPTAGESYGAFGGLFT